MNPAAFILILPSMCGPKKNCFCFLHRLKVWPLYLLSSLHPSLSHSPSSLSLSMSFSLRVDNVSANDLTALVEAPSSNWTSRDWVLYRKTIVILSQISTTLRFNKTLPGIGLCRLLRGSELKKGIRFAFFSKEKKRKKERQNGCH